ncbi:MAG: hypothetical protein H8F28_14560 [Fibrella sp.]|nr:hypothetical protein [Armatimonadota bacterium]
MSSRHIYPIKPPEQAPVCPHCSGTRLVKDGHDGDRQRYTCRGCNRRSFGVLPAPEPYLKCAACRGKLWQQRKPDGRTKFICSQCGKSRMSEYKAATREASKVFRYRHKFAVVLNRHAQRGLAEYVQAKRCTDAQAVRAIFRHVLTGEVFGTGSVSRAGRSGAIPIPRDRAAAAMKFPNLNSESAKKKLVGAGEHFGRGFHPTVLGVQTITVLLDDEAKEGLVYTMRRLELNHADAARWLLTNVKMPDAKTPEYLRLHPEPFTVATGAKRPRYEWEKGYDPGWDD